jgi:hypothetical protein
MQDVMQEVTMVEVTMVELTAEEIESVSGGATAIEFGHQQ